MQGKGYKRSLLINKETSFGVTDSLSSVKMPFFSCMIAEKKDLVNSELINSNRIRSKPINGQIDVAGSITIPLDVNYIGYWLEIAIGKSISQENETGIYKHVFIPSNLQNSLSIEHGLKNPNHYSLFNGVKINSMSFEFGDNQELKSSIDVLGKEEIVSTNSIGDTVMPVEHDFIPFYIVNAGIKLNNSVVANVTKCTININNNLDGNIRTIGSGSKRHDISEGFFDLSGSITAMFESQEYWLSAKNSTESSLEVVLQKDTSSLTIIIPSLVYEQGQTLDGQGGLYVDLPFKMFKNNNDFQIKLVNNVEKYFNSQQMI